jgi:hypothetical protein
MKNLFILVLLFFSKTIFSQDLQNANWVFGTKNTLNFNTTIPTAGSLASTTGFVGFEGCASVSDSSGNLLLFSDGVRLWKRSLGVDVLITSQLKGNSSSAQNVIFVKKPSFQNSYYVVTISGESGGVKGLFYSEVDVVTATMISLNNPFKDDLGVSIDETYLNKSEAVTSTIHADSNKYWVIAHVQKGVQGRVYSYLIDSSGINVNPSSTTTMNPSSNPIADGSFGLCLKTSPDNLKIGLSFGRSGVFVGDFTNNTGAVTFNNPVIYDGVFPNYDSKTINSYGLEFSPDSNIFYFTSSNASITSAYLNRVVVSPTLNLATLTTTAFSPSNTNAAGLQRGIDDRLYIAAYSNNLSVINNPNNFSNPQIVENSIPLVSNSGLCLPQWVWQHPCQDTLVDDRYPLPGIVFEERSDWIKSTALVHTTARVYYKAANYIELLPDNSISLGFEAENGAEFVAYIEGCTGNYVYRTPSSSTSNNTINEVDEAQLISIKKEFIIIPNPSSNFIEVVLKNSMFNKITITSIDGKTVYEKTVDNQDATQIDTSSYENGLYLVSVFTEDGQVLTEKLIKK